MGQEHECMDEQAVKLDVVGTGGVANLGRP